MTNWNGKVLPIKSVKYKMDWWNYYCNICEEDLIRDDYCGDMNSLVGEMVEDESCVILAVRC